MPTRIGPAIESSPPFAEGQSSPARRRADGSRAASPHDRAVPNARASDPASTSLPLASLPSGLAGYRVVRVLGRDDRAVTVLVHAAGAPLVARVLAPDASDADVDAEVAVHDAIARADPALRRHAVALRDLATLPDGRFVLMLEQIPGPRLDDLLAARRGGLALGEAVTALAPIATAIESAHRVGVTGLGLDPAAVRLRPSGAPVIVRVQDALSGPALPDRFRAADDAHLADRAALERLGAAVAAAVVEQDRPALLAALRAPERGSLLAHALFDLAEPQPLRTSGSVHERGRDSTLVPVDRVGRPLTAADDPQGLIAAPKGPPADSTRQRQQGEFGRATASSGDDPRRPRAVGVLLRTLREVGLPAALVDVIEGGLDRALSRLAALVERWPRPTSRAIVRPRFVIAGAGGAAAVVLAIVLGAIGDGPAPHEDAGDTSGVVPGAQYGAASDNDADAADRTPAADTGAPELIIDPQPEEWTSIVEALVDRWSACRAGADSGATAACTTSVTHSGSAAAALIVADDDRHAMLQQWRDRGGEVVVVERMGAAVLVDLIAGTTTTASLLIVRSEAGWRIRDVVG